MAHMDAPNTSALLMMWVPAVRAITTNILVVTQQGIFSCFASGMLADVSLDQPLSTVGIGVQDVSS